MASVILVKLTLTEQTDEAPDETTTSAADPSQDQVGLGQYFPRGLLRVASHTLGRPQGTAPSNRFYCQEEDCGRGFSTKGFLDTHVKFFHPKKVTISWGLEIIC